MLAQLTQPVVDPRSLSGAHPLTTALVMISTLACGIVIASVYKWTHRGLSYSQAFQFSLVMLGMLGAGIMLVASTGVIPAIGIIGGFSLIEPNGGSDASLLTATSPRPASRSADSP